MKEEYTDVSDSRIEEPQLEMVVNIKRSFWERWKGWFLMVIGMGIGDFIVEPLLKIFPDKNWLHITFLALGVVFLVVIIVIIIMGAKDYMRFVWPEFFKNLAFAVVLLAIYFLLFIYPKTFLKDSKIFKFGILGLAGVVSLGILLNFSINRISYNDGIFMHIFNRRDNGSKKRR